MAHWPFGEVSDHELVSAAKMVPSEKNTNTAQKKPSRLLAFIIENMALILLAEFDNAGFKRL